MQLHIIKISMRCNNEEFAIANIGQNLNIQKALESELN